SGVHVLRPAVIGVADAQQGRDRVAGVAAAAFLGFAQQPRAAGRDDRDEEAQRRRWRRELATAARAQYLDLPRAIALAALRQRHAQVGPVAALRAVDAGGSGADDRAARRAKTHVEPGIGAVPAD